MDAHQMTEPKEELKPLNKVNQKILDEYLICFNQWKAYKAGHPRVTDESARTLSSRLFADVDFSAHVTARLNEVHMSADEALKLMADIARGDVAQIMDVSSVGFNLDMSKAQRLGMTKLIKKVKQKTTIYSAKKESEEDREVTELEVELYPADNALEKILKVHGKFTERVDVTSGGESISPKMTDEERMESMKKIAIAIVQEIKK